MSSETCRKGLNKFSCKGMNSREILKKAENRPKIKNFKNTLEVIPSIQTHCKLHGKVSQTMLHKNKPLGVLIYAF